MYYFYPKRLTNIFLVRKLKSTNMYTILDRADGDRLAHRDSEGNILTQLGIEYVEGMLKAHTQH
jgi:hypothetical protein